MSLWEQAGLRLLHRLDPETAHGLSLRALGSGLLPLPGRVTSPRLAVTLAGMALDNPVGSGSVNPGFSILEKVPVLSSTHIKKNSVPDSVAEP